MINIKDIYKYNTNNYLVLDLETTNLEYGTALVPDNQLLLASWYSPSRGLQNHVGSEYEQEALLRDVQSAELIVAHNTKFELQWLDRMGIDLTKVLPWCTMLAEYTIGSNRRWNLDLDACLARRNIASKKQMVKTLIHKGVDPKLIPVHWLSDYCDQDVLSTLELFHRQREEIYSLGLEKVLFTRNMFSVVISDMEKYGMCMDTERVNEFYTRYDGELREVERELTQITGGINPRSASQVAEFLYSTLGFDEPKDWRGNPFRTKGGKPSVGSDVIEKLEATTEQQRRFLDVKKRQSVLEAALSKSLRKFKEALDDGDNFLYASINQTRTATGRTSSTGRKRSVQFQNIDRDFKGLFCARHRDYYVAESDAKQLEFRVACDMARDVQGLQDISDGVDVHSKTASVTKLSRTASKPWTFKPLYGGTSGPPHIRKYFKYFRNRYPEVAKLQEGWSLSAIRSKEVVMPTGYRFYFPNARFDDRGGIAWPERGNVYNYPVQYFATGEIVPIWVLLLWHYLREHKCRTFLINTIHDSVIAEVHKDEVELYEELVVKSMEEVREYVKGLYDYEIVIPLECDTKINAHWGEEKE